MSNEPQTPLGRVAKNAARFGFDAADADNPTMEFDRFGENGFSQEIQNHAPAIMWDAIAEAVVSRYREWILEQYRTLVAQHPDGL